MAITFLNRSSFGAPPSKGKVATKPTITIGENGSMTFNSLASKVLEGSTKVGIAYDADKRLVIVYPSGHKQVVKTAKENPDALFEVKCSYPPSKLYGFKNASWILNTVLPAPHYDYKASGNQSFDVNHDEKNGVLTFVLPEKATPRPKVARAKKAKKVNEVRAEVGSGQALPNGSTDGEDLLLPV
jgi:hypothetical protein